jgi:hypothetical protein
VSKKTLIKTNLYSYFLYNTYYVFLITALEKTVTLSVAEIKEDLKELLRRCNFHAAEESENSRSQFPVSFPVEHKDNLLELNTWLSLEGNSALLVSLFRIILAT